MWIGHAPNSWVTTMKVFPIIPVDWINPLSIIHPGLLLSNDCLPQPTILYRVHLQPAIHSSRFRVWDLNVDFAMVEWIF